MGKLGKLFVDAVRNSLYGRRPDIYTTPKPYIMPGGENLIEYKTFFFLIEDIGSSYWEEFPPLPLVMDYR